MLIDIAEESDYILLNINFIFYSTIYYYNSITRCPNLQKYQAIESTLSDMLSDLQFCLWMTTNVCHLQKKHKNLYDYVHVRFTNNI